MGTVKSSKLVKIKKTTPTDLDELLWSFLAAQAMIDKYGLPVRGGQRVKSPRGGGNQKSHHEC